MVEIALNKLWKLVFWGILLGYPSISMRVMRIFECEEIDNEFRLVRDYELVCFNGKWTSYASAANLAIFLYVIGAPFAFFYLLWKARNDHVKLIWDGAIVNEDRMKQLLREAKQDSSISGLFWKDPHDIVEQKRAIIAYLRRRNMRLHTNQTRLGFLYYAYNEGVWWYEVVELFRKFTLNGVVVTIGIGQTPKIVFGMLLCLLFLVMVQNVHPHKAESDHILMVLTHVQLFVTMFAGLVLTEKVQFMEAFTPNRREARVQEQAFVEIFVITTHLGTLLYGMACVFYERHFSPEVMKILKREAHHKAVLKQLKASAKRGWKQVSLKSKFMKKKSLIGKLGEKAGTKAAQDSIMDLIAENELEEMSSQEVKVVSLKSAQRKIMARLQAKRSISSALGSKGDGVGGLLSAFSNKKKSSNTKVAPEIEVEELRKANEAINSLSGENSKEVDFNWGDGDDLSERKLMESVAPEKSDVSTKNETSEDSLISGASDLKRMLAENKQRAKEIQNVFKNQALLRAKALTKIKRMHGSYGTDKKAIESAKINLQQAVEGKSLKVLKNEIANIKANPKISEILKKEVGKAEMVLRNKTDELINALQSAMDDTSNPNQKEKLERVLDDITAVGIEGHDEKIQHAVDKLVHLEHLKKLEAMVSGLSQRTIAEIKSFTSPSPMLVNVIQCVFIFLGHSKEDVETWKLCCKWLGKTGKQGLRRRISTLDVASVSDQTIKFIAQELKEVNIDEVAKQSKGVATLYAWLSGMISERTLES